MNFSERILPSSADNCLPPEEAFPNREVLYEAMNKLGLPRDYALVVDGR